MAAGEGPLPVTQSRNNLVDLARFERATSTFAESRSHSAELQVRELAEAAGIEPAHAKRGDLANRCHTVRRRLQRLSDMLQLVAQSGRKTSSPENDKLKFVGHEYQLGYPSKTFPIAHCRLSIQQVGRSTNWQIGNWQSAMFCSATHARMEFRFQVSHARFQI